MRRNKDKNSFGLTGGIGAGKTTVADRFRLLGAVVLDADEISRHALDLGTACYEEAVRHFGSIILEEDGRINRSSVAGIVFNDEKERQILNGIIHPYVLDMMFRSRDEAVADDPGAVVVFDIPLLIECGAYRKMNKNIVVVSDDAIRIRRVMERSDLSEQQVLARMENQIPQEKQKKHADFLIENNLGLEELYARTDSVYEQLKELVR